MFSAAEAGRALTDVDQPILVAIDQRPQQHAADDAEDRGVGADAERERDDDGGGEAFGAQERAQADAHVLHEAAAASNQRLYQTRRIESRIAGT